MHPEEGGGVGEAEVHSADSWFFGWVAFGAVFVEEDKAEFRAVPDGEGAGHNLPVFGEEGVPA